MAYQQTTTTYSNQVVYQNPSPTITTTEYRPLTGQVVTPGFPLSMYFDAYRDQNRKLVSYYGIGCAAAAVICFASSFLAYYVAIDFMWLICVLSILCVCTPGLVSIMLVTQSLKRQALNELTPNVTTLIILGFSLVALSFGAWICRIVTYFILTSSYAAVMLFFVLHCIFGIGSCAGGALYYFLIFYTAGVPRVGNY